MSGTYTIRRGLSALITLLCLLTAVPMASADYLPQGQEQEMVESVEVVGSYLDSDAFILSRLELRTLSSDVVEDLIEVVDTRRFGVKARSRALQSLALYAWEDARAKEAIGEAIETFKPGHSLCPTSIVAYGEAFGEESIDKLATLENTKRVDVRMAVVVAYGRFGGQEGFSKLVEMAEQEQHGQIRARIESYIH